MSTIKLNTTGGSGGSVALKGPASTTGNADIELTLPQNDGNANQLLKTDGSGTLSWVDDTDTTNTNASNLASGTLPAARIADDSIVEAKLDVSNAPTNGQFLQAQSGEGGGLTWAAAGGGKILQIVQGETTTEVEITSTSFTDSGLSASITPSATSSKILILVSQHYCIYRHDDDNNGGIVLLRDSTVIGSYLKNSSDKLWGVGGDWQNGGMDRSSLRLRWTHTYLDSPNTTSATTYKTQGAVYAGSDDEKITFQRASSGTNAGSYIQLLEVGA